MAQLPRLAGFLVPVRGKLCHLLLCPGGMVRGISKLCPKLHAEGYRTTQPAGGILLCHSVGNQAGMWPAQHWETATFDRGYLEMALPLPPPSTETPILSAGCGAAPQGIGCRGAGCSTAEQGLTSLTSCVSHASAGRPPSTESVAVKDLFCCFLWSHTLASSGRDETSKPPWTFRLPGSCG